MRLEVLCEDRLGLTRELLDILASKQIDLRGIEIDAAGYIYLNCPEVEFNSFSQLMTKIRKISGVADVKKVQFMPSERHSTELTSLLENLPEAVLSINLKGEIDIVNHSACNLLSKTRCQLIGLPLSQVVPNFSHSKWLENDALRTRQSITVDGLDYVIEIIPVYVHGDSKEDKVLASAVVTLKPDINDKLAPQFLAESNQLGFEHLVGVSKRHKALIVQAKKLAMLDQPLLIEGETGVGKEMLARACHDRSKRALKPFLVVSCASMPDDVAETELFGIGTGGSTLASSQKGIFEQADGGTVFLDKIGEMSQHLQLKLLRFLQDGTFRRVGEEHEVHVDVRVIASALPNLAQLTEEGLFREDLYYRLNVLTLRIPPLRERPNDIYPLLALFIKQHAQSLAIEPPAFSESLFNELAQYSWPGNVRELGNSVLRALTQFNELELSIDDFQLPKREGEILGMLPNNLEGSLDEIMKEYESKILENLYQAFPSSRRLAKRLGVSHTSIANKLREYQIRKL